MDVTCTPAGRTVSKASMARVQEKAFWSKSLLSACSPAEQLRVVGLAHQGFGILALGANESNSAVERVLARAGRFCLPVEEVQADAKKNADCCEHSHGDAQPFESRPKIGKRAGGEIESDSHFFLSFSELSYRFALVRPAARQRACYAGKTGLRKRSRCSAFRARRPFDDGQIGPPGDRMAANSSALTIPA